MPSINYKTVLEALLPHGSLWRPAPEDGFDLLLDGMADNWTVIWNFLASMTYIRDPYKTPVLDDLEREFGIWPNPSLTDRERREKLAAVKFARVGTGSKDNLENALHKAGFVVQVLSNGNFDKDLSSWIITGSTSWLSPGYIKLVNNVSTADQPMTTVIGTEYTVRWKVLSGSNGSVEIGTAQGLSDLLSVSWTETGDIIAQFIATGTTTWIRLEGSSGDVVVLDRISVTAHPTLYVWENSPAQDPSIFFVASLMQCGEPLAQCGEPDAQAQHFTGELIVNGDIFDFTVDYVVQCGETLAQCGEYTALAGNFTGVTRTKIEYPIPTDPKDWPLVFFVGGPATFCACTGSAIYCGDTLAQCGEPLAQCANFIGQIQDIEWVDLPQSRRADLVRLILQIKPIHSWCALLVNFT